MQISNIQQNSFTNNEINQRTNKSILYHKEKAERECALDGIQEIAFNIYSRAQSEIATTFNTER